MYDVKNKEFLSLADQSQNVRTTSFPGCLAAGHWA